jgi:hypothetical protein
MSLSTRLFLFLFGLPFLAVGIGIGVFATRSVQAELARAEALQPSSAAALRQRGLGSEVLVEGRIDPRTPLQFRDFVAYEQAEYRGTDEDDDEVWVVEERVLPALLIDAGGTLTIAEGYTLQGEHAHWQESDTLQWNGFTGEGTKRYTGLVANQPVMAIGTVGSGGAAPTLNAEFVYAGTREAYLADRRNTIAFLPWFGAIFGLVGLGLMSAPVISWVRRRV